jgi:uncharacterized protein (DUF302 family)
MLHIEETPKTVDAAARDLEAAVTRNGFGVIAVFDFREKMKEKGVDFPNECRVLEVCNPKQAARVLAADMRVSLVLPCRISVYEENGKTWIGTVLPTALLGLFPGAGALLPVAEEVEATLLKIIAEAK